MKKTIEACMNIVVKPLMAGMDVYEIKSEPTIFMQSQRIWEYFGVHNVTERGY